MQQFKLVKPVARIICLALLSVCVAQATLAAEDPVLVLKAPRAFDSIHGTLVEPGIVVIRGNSIQAMGSNVSIPAGAKVIELKDATLMPGFVDAHVHLSEESGSDWYQDFYQGEIRFPAEQSLYGAHYARATLHAGFTTVRDLGSRDYTARSLRNAINAEQIEGPRMVVANYGIGSSGGHADDAPFPPQRVKLSTPLEGVCNGADQCREATRLQMKFGADVIKMMPSGGVLSLSDPVDNVQMTQEEMNAVVSEAHAWGRKVAAHCHGDKAAKMAIAAGVDSIEHGSFLQDDTLALMKAKHVVLVPTIFAGYYVGVHADKFPPAIQPKARAAANAIQQMFQRAAKIGVPVALGTDAGVEPHGQNATEFMLMVKNGFTPAQALTAGTLNGAQLLGLDEHLGSLDAGKWADVVAVKGNPLKDITVTQHPVLVVKNGQVVFQE